MTERQLLGFYDASIRLEASSRANAIEDSAAAIGMALGDKAAATRPQQLRNQK